MPLNALTALCPLDGRYAHVTAIISESFSEYALIKQRFKVEALWFLHLAKHKEIEEVPALDETTVTALNEWIDEFSLEDAERVKTIEAETNHDVKAVEYFLKEKMNNHPTLSVIKEFVHFGLTSEDVNNLAYSLMLTDALSMCILPKLDKLLNDMKARAHIHALNPMLSHTHGQTATPTTMGKEFANFYFRLERKIKVLNQFKFLAKLNGAVGNYNAFHVAYPELNWPEICRDFVENTLALQWNPYTTQIENHDGIAEFCHNLHHINVILIDFSKDIWSYISRQFFILKTREGEIGSSTMPHKVNPIDFENAEGNLGLANALLTFFAEKLPISRLQRDLSDSTVMRNLGMALGYAVLAYYSLDKGLRKLELNHQHLIEQLDAHWEVLAEAIQMILRRHGIETPYEKLKQLTRGKTVTKTSLHAFIDSLDIDDSLRKTLKTLTPENYIGYAATLAKIG